MIEIYTDGACSGNQFKNNVGAYAYVILIDKKEIKRYVQHELNTTNNRMEMLAVISALEHVKNNLFKDEEQLNILLYSDSQYVISTINEGWKKKKNVDLWQRLDEVMKYFFKNDILIYFHKVKGHSNNYYNNLVDELAVNKISKYKGA